MSKKLATHTFNRYLWFVFVFVPLALIKHIYGEEWTQQQQQQPLPKSKQA